MSRWLHPWVGRVPWRRMCQPTPVFLPGEPHGQRSRTGCSPWGRRVRHGWSDWAPRPVSYQRKWEQRELFYIRYLFSHEYLDALLSWFIKEPENFQIQGRISRNLLIIYCMQNAASRNACFFFFFFFPPSLSAGHCRSRGQHHVTRSKDLFLVALQKKKKQQPRFSN